MSRPDAPVRRCPIWRRVFCLSILLGVGISAIWHFTIRDAWDWPWCFLYYGAARPVLLGATCFAWALVRRRARRLSRVAGVSCLALAGWILGADCVWNWGDVPPPDAGALRIVTWNAAHLPRGRGVAAQVIRSWNADLIGVVEAGSSDDASLAEWRSLLPEYTVIAPRVGMLWIVRGTVEAGPLKTIYRQSDALPATASIKGQAVPVVLVDITSEITHNRRGPNAGLCTFLKEQPELPAIVMGDFNTPADTRWFAELKQLMRNAFAEHGVGYRPTWPIVWPSLELDYLWVSPRVTVHRCWHGWTFASDHRPVLADVTIVTNNRDLVEP